MTEPSNDEVVEALEQLADAQAVPAAEEPGAPVEHTRAEFTPSEIGAGPAVQVDPPEIVDAEEEIEEPDEVEMDLPAEGEAALVVTPTRTSKPPAPPLYQTISFRRTIIPILLTCGTLTLALSSLKFVLGPDSIFSDFPAWLPVALGVAGAVLLVLAGLNMAAVKHSN